MEVFFVLLLCGVIEPVEAQRPQDQAGTNLGVVIVISFWQLDQQGFWAFAQEPQLLSTEHRFARTGKAVEFHAASPPDWHEDRTKAKGVRLAVRLKADVARDGDVIVTGSIKYWVRFTDGGWALPGLSLLEQRTRFREEFGRWVGERRKYRVAFGKSPGWERNIYAPTMFGFGGMVLPLPPPLEAPNP